MATAVAGAILGINPFNQPDVEASKIKTRELTAAFEKTGALPAEKPVVRPTRPISTPTSTTPPSCARPAPTATLGSWIKAHLRASRSGDYVALLAYIARDERGTIGSLQKMRLRCATRGTSRPAPNSARASCTPPGRPTRAAPTAACSCRSPADDAKDLQVPGQKASFGIIKAAQARGDFDVLTERGRRALRPSQGRSRIGPRPRSMPRLRQGALSKESGDLMQLGMIGLGRMGGNIVRRLMKHGHTAVVYDKDAKAVRGSPPKAQPAPATLEDFVAQLEKPRTGLGDAAGRQITEATIESAGAHAARRRHHRRRQHVLEGRRPPRRGAEGKRHPLSRRRHQRRRLGPRTRLLHDDRRREGWSTGSIRSSPRWRRASATSRARPAPEGRDPRIEQGYIHAGPTAPDTSSR